jgi:hypothetical protein
MKHLLIGFTAITLVIQITSCSSEEEIKQPEQLQTSVKDSTEVAEWFPETNYDTLRGMYSGDFGDGFINVILTYVNDKKAIGYNIHKGLQRNISGSVIQKKDHFELTLNEPGDNEFDGVFVLEIAKKDFSVQATWTANNPKISVKKFKLKKKIVKTTEELEKFYDDGGKVSEENFLDYFSEANCNEDLVEFNENGIVHYTYYPTKDSEKRKEQLESFKGSWRFINPETVVVEWQKNNRYKERKMSFKITRLSEEEGGFVVLKGDQITISPDIF